MREMRADDGAFYSSLDADSEGEEGKFYVWTPDEARALLSPDEWAVAAPYLRPRPARRISRATRGTCACVEPLDARRRPARRSRCPTRRRGSSAPRRRCSPRARTRVRPGLDDKMLTSWNALAIAGLARAARALDEPRWADLAFAALDALRRTAWRDGRLLATRRGERAELNAYLDDHAFLLAALIELMQTRFRREDWDCARALADALLDAVRGPRARRLLVHEPRPRDAVPSHQARPRQRDAVGQRRRRAGADRARPSRRRAALRRSRRAHGAAVRADRSRSRRAAIRRC